MHAWHARARGGAPARKPCSRLHCTPPLPAPRVQHIMIDLGTGNNNKINWAMNDKQEFIDIVETVYRGARKGRGLVVSPKGTSVIASGVPVAQGIAVSQGAAMPVHWHRHQPAQPYMNLPCSCCRLLD